MVYPSAFVLIAHSDLPVPPSTGASVHNTTSIQQNTAATKDPSPCRMPLTPPTSPDQAVPGKSDNVKSVYMTLYIKTFEKCNMHDPETYILLRKMKSSYLNSRTKKTIILQLASP